MIRTIRRRRPRRPPSAEALALAERLLAGDPQIVALLDRIIAEGDRALAELVAELEMQPPQVCDDPPLSPIVSRE